LGYTYKKAKLTLASPIRPSEAFLETTKRSRKKEESDPIYFRTPPTRQHNPRHRLWLISAEDYRSRATPPPALNITRHRDQTYSAEIRFDVTIDAPRPSPCSSNREGKPQPAHCRDLRQRPLLTVLGRFRSNLKPRDTLEFRRPIRPISTHRALWKFFKRRCSTTDTTRHSRSTRTPLAVLARLDAYVPATRTLLTENFEIIAIEMPKFGIRYV